MYIHYSPPFSNSVSFRCVYLLDHSSVFCIISFLSLGHLVPFMFGFVPVRITFLSRILFPKYMLCITHQPRCIYIAILLFVLKLISLFWRFFLFQCIRFEFVFALHFHLSTSKLENWNKRGAILNKQLLTRRRKRKQHTNE